MMGCTNEATQWVPRGFDYSYSVWAPEPSYYTEQKGECGRTGIDGEPVYCVECRDANERRGFAKHQCQHSVDLYPEDGRDIPCGLCEGGA